MYLSCTAFFEGGSENNGKPFKFEEATYHAWQRLPYTSAPLVFNHETHVEGTFLPHVAPNSLFDFFYESCMFFHGKPLKIKINKYIKIFSKIVTYRYFLIKRKIVFIFYYVVYQIICRFYVTSATTSHLTPCFQHDKLENETLCGHLYTVGSANEYQKNIILLIS